MENVESDRCKFRKELDTKNEQLKQKNKQNESLKLKHERHVNEQKTLNDNLSNKIDTVQKKLVCSLRTP